MITTGSKWYYGFGFVALVLAAAYGWTTGGNGLGPVTVGYKGGVGDHFGYGILLSAAVVSIFLGAVTTATRDAEAEAEAEVAGTDTVPEVTPAGASYWPPVAALGAGLVVVGLVASSILFVFGLVVLGIVLVEWAVQSWADRATGDPETNRAVRNRLMNPIEYPAAAFLALALLAVAMAQLFLALSAEATVWVALALAVAVAAVGALMAAKPRISSNVVVALVVLGAVVVIGIGIASAAVGPREFHEHHGPEDEAEPAGEGALAPLPADAVTVEVDR